MKKFLFTLAALLMAATAFAQTDAKYLYVNSELTVEDPDVENGLILTISAEFPGRLNAMECNLILPEGMTCTMLEVGPDAKVYYVDSRGRSKSGDPSLSTIDNLHFVMLAPIVDGFWQDPNGENPSAWVRYGAAKWEAGDYEEFVYAYVEYDDTYHGGQAYVQTIPSSGVDSRGETIADMGDKSREDIITPATEPLEDPSPAQAPDAPVITFSGEETTTMTVTVTAADGCTLIVNGEAVEGNPYSYTVDRDDIYTPGTVNVTAKAVKDGLESVEASDSKDFVVADRPVADQPVINFVETKNDNDEVVSVEVVVTNATSYIITVDGVEVDAAVVNANYEADQVIHVEAVNDPGYPYEENTNEADYTLVKLAKKDVVAPEITYVVNDDAVVVTVNWPNSDGDQVYTGEYTYIRPEYGQPDESYDVEAYVTAGPTSNESAHATEVIVVPAKDPVWEEVAAPVISYEVEDEQVVVTIQWPETTGNQVYTGQYTYDRPAPGEETAMYDVEAYTEADYPYMESAHAYLTIFVPALPTPKTDKPVISSVDNGEGILVTVTGEGNIVLYVEGEQVAEGPSPLTYLLPYSEYIEGDLVAVSATAQGENMLISDYAIAEIEVPYKPQAAAEPVIEFVETKNENDEVVSVEVVVTNATEYHIWVDGNQLRGEVIAANYEAAQAIHVEAINNPGYPYLENTNEADYTLNKLAKKAVDKPVITTDMDENNVYVTIQWPAETDGNQVYTGEYTYERTYEDQSFPVEAYVEAGTEWLASEVAQETILVPAMDVPKPTIVVTPVSGEGTGDGKGYYQITITDVDEDAEILYQITYPDGTQSGWMPYDAAFAVKQGDGLGDYVIEAKAVVDGKESEVAEAPFTLSETTGVEMLNGEKAVAGVRYFNLAGQEMQEANGMTIVVTTYTDGTTSAVKVMK